MKAYLSADSAAGTCIACSCYRLVGGFSNFSHVSCLLLLAVCCTIFNVLGISCGCGSHAACYRSLGFGWPPIPHAARTEANWLTLHRRLTLQCLALLFEQSTWNGLLHSCLRLLTRDVTCTIPVFIKIINAWKLFYIPSSPGLRDEWINELVPVTN